MSADVLSPAAFADHLRNELKDMLPPARMASVAEKKKWLANHGGTRAFSLRTDEVDKVLAKLAASTRKAVTAILDKLQDKYVGFEGMSWAEYKAATIKHLFSSREDDARFRQEAKRISDRAYGRGTGYFLGILSRALATDTDRIEKRLYHRWHIELLNAGAKMETTKEMIGAVSEELKRARQEMQDLANEVTTMSELVSVKLAKQLESIRNSRMTAVRELQDVLAPLKALRAFFDDGGDQDVNRLEKLNALCSQLEGFHRSGALSGLVTALQTMSRVPHEG